MRTWAIVVAAGTGRRFGGAKQLEELDGLPLWKRATTALVEGGVEHVVVVGEDVGGVPGGRRRQDSVGNGLLHVPDGIDFVLVHDAARAAASAALVAAVIARLSEGDVDAVVPAIPVRDTIRRVDGEEAKGTVDRAGLVAVQTPQGFRTEALRRAHGEIRDDVTDDAQMVERLGGRVVIVPGEPSNLKVTYREDLELLRGMVT